MTAVKDPRISDPYAAEAAIDFAMETDNEPAALSFLRSWRYAKIFGSAAYIAWWPEFNVDKWRRTCYAVQHSDLTVCARCGLSWDTNDPEEPKCGKTH